MPSVQSGLEDVMHFRSLIAALAVLVIIVAATWAAAQTVFVEKVTPTVVSGENVGFRVEGLRGGSTPVGRIVVRINGQWVTAELASGPLPLSTQ
jgi:hypothetical protein